MLTITKEVYGFIKFIKGVWELNCLLGELERIVYEYNEKVEYGDYIYLELVRESMSNRYDKEELRMLIEDIKKL